MSATGFLPGELRVMRGQGGGPTDRAPRHLLAGILLRAKAAGWTRGLWQEAASRAAHRQALQKVRAREVRDLEGFSEEQGH